MSALRHLAARLRRSQRATAATEFALAAPLLMSLGLAGAETAHRAVVQMRVNQIAVLVADNAARVGENSLLGEVSLYESDINDIFLGAQLQGGESFDLLANGRVILSSLEVVPGEDVQQYIHWQRCAGLLQHQSSYGAAGDGLTEAIAGMGPPGQEVIAFPGEAVMFVEVAYRHRPLVLDMFEAERPIIAIAAFNVRNNRDLSGVKQRDPYDPDPVAACGQHDETAPRPADPGVGGAPSPEPTPTPTPSPTPAPTPTTPEPGKGPKGPKAP